METAPVIIVKRNIPPTHVARCRNVLEGIRHKFNEMLPSMVVHYVISGDVPDGSEMNSIEVNLFPQEERLPVTYQLQVLAAIRSLSHPSQFQEMYCQGQS